jgi:hypothetical protein
MTAFAAAFADPKPGLVLASGRLVVRLEAEADLESEAARLAAERFARALEKATQYPLPSVERLESRRRRRRSEGSERSDVAGWPGRVLLPVRPPRQI